MARFRRQPQPTGYNATGVVQLVIASGAKQAHTLRALLMQLAALGLDEHRLNSHLPSDRGRRQGKGEEAITDVATCGMPRPCRVVLTGSIALYRFSAAGQPQHPPPCYAVLRERQGFSPSVRPQVVYNGMEFWKLKGRLGGRPFRHSRGRAISEGPPPSCRPRPSYRGR